MRTEIPTGLVGLHPREPVGCHLNVAVKGQNGAPDYKGRFWLTSQLTHSHEFRTGSGKAYAQLARDLHPSFVAWNEAALALGRDVSRKGPGRLGVIRGNIVHARFEDAAFWNRAAQKLPEGHPNPPSRRPACEGNGIWAQRYVGMENGKERFDRIACPNRECVFALQGLCKVSAHLIFRLRWNTGDPWESQFPSLLCEWNTRGFESAENMLGLFEHVLGTEALLPEEQRRLATPEERAKWKVGLAHGLGIPNPSLVGLPFVMTVGDKTKAADAGSSTGKRYPVVKFSPDGDLVEWLLIQGRRRRELSAGAGAPLSLPASVQDAEFLETVRHDSRVEIDPTVIKAQTVAEEVDRRDPEGAHGETLGQVGPEPEQIRPTPVIGPAGAARLRKAAEGVGMSEEQFVQQFGPEPETIPASEEMAWLRKISGWKNPERERRKR